jgi:outer membrane protein assembly factor BamE
MIPRRIFIPFLAAAALLAGCGVPRIPGLTPYKMDIQQGNFVSQEMVSQLKAGMSKEQVRFVLGTPLVTDIFHSDRWDYVYWREAPDGKREQRKLVVFFADGKLVRLDGDVAPAKIGGAAPPAKTDSDASAASVGSDAAPAKVTQ